MPTDSKRIALVRGPYLRPDGVRQWESLHQNTPYDVVAFESDPARFDTSGLSMPVESLPWLDGKLDLFGYDYFFSRVIQKCRFPSDYLVGLNELTDRFDVIHTSENFNLFSLQAAMATSRTETTFVFSAGQNIPYPMFQHNPLLWRVKRYVNSAADAVTTTTTAGKRAHIHEGVPPEKISVLPNSVDTEMFLPLEQPDPAKIGLPAELSDTTNILFVHELCEQKGTPYLINAFDKLVGDEYRLILVGENKLNLNTRVSDRERIVHVKQVPYEKMPLLYNLASIFVLPSVTMPNNEEQFGMAVLEAMACGVPTVTTDVGGLPYVVEERETSLVVPERDTDALYQAIKRLLQSSERRQELGLNGRGRAVEKFDPDQIAETLRNLYDDIL